MILYASVILSIHSDILLKNDIKPFVNYEDAKEYIINIENEWLNNRLTLEFIRKDFTPDEAVNFNTNKFLDNIKKIYDKEIYFHCYKEYNNIDIFEITMLEI